MSDLEESPNISPEISPDSDSEKQALPLADDNASDRDNASPASDDEAEKQLLGKTEETNPKETTASNTEEGNEVVSPVPTPPKLNYLPHLMQTVLMLFFGVRLFVLGLLSSTVYNYPNVVTTGLLWSWVWYLLYGALSTLLMLLTVGSTLLYENWDWVTTALATLRLVSPHLATVLTMAENGAGGVQRVKNLVVDKVSHLGLWDKVTGWYLTIVTNPVVSTVLTTLDSLLGKLVGLLKSVPLPQPSLSMIPEQTISEGRSKEMQLKRLEDELKENSDEIEVVEDEEPSEPELKEKNLTESDLKRINKETEQMMSALLGGTIDFSRLPPPPKNPKDLKKQMDEMIGLVQQTQQIADKLRQQKHDK